MELKDYRQEIDRIDRELTALFERRMRIAEEIARYKIENGLPVLDAAREREKLLSIRSLISPELADSAARLYERIFALSRERQRLLMGVERAERGIVLIGMPGAGKSTVARALGALCGRPAVLADEEVVKRAGISIPEIFAAEGEEGFCRRETAFLREAAEQTGIILATGGGCVTRPENVPLLRRCGLIVWIERDTALLSTEGRPISQSRDLGELYRERLPLYQSIAQVHVHNDGTPEETAAEIIREIAESETPA